MNPIIQIIRKIISFITGSGKGRTVEHVNFNALLFVATILSYVSLIFNFIAGLGPVLTGFTLFSFTVLSLLYFLSRFRGYYNLLLSAAIITMLLSILWFMNGGAIGSVTYIYLLSLIVFVIMARRYEQNTVFWIFLFNLVMLYLLQYLFGAELVHGYTNPDVYYADMIFVFVMVFFSIFFLVRFIKRRYDEERSKTEEQKQIIEGQNTELVASLTYASYLQKRIISDEKQLRYLFSDYFVLFSPKDIVSGDFFWVKEVGKYGIVVAADCTGHGVPAAFLSILGISLLEEVMRPDREDPDAGTLLDKFRSRFVSHLQKNNISEHHLRDGIDMALCLVSHEDYTFQYAGAHRPLLLVRHNSNPEPRGYTEKETSGDHTLYIYKATKNTVGFNYNEVPFTGHAIDFFPEDTFYFFSDGFSDQFDAVNRKKFTVGRLKKEILKLQGTPLPLQEEYLRRLHLKWKGDTGQTDDVLVIGMRI